MFVKWSDAGKIIANEEHGRRVIYALVDPRDETVRYVGVTSWASGLSARLALHLRSPTNRKTLAWFSELSDLGLRPEIRPLTSARGNWERVERECIFRFRALGELLNIDPGGICRGPSGEPIKRKMKVYRAPVSLAESRRQSAVDKLAAKAAKISRRQMDRLHGVEPPHVARAKIERQATEERRAFLVQSMWGRR